MSMMVASLVLLSAEISTDSAKCPQPCSVCMTPNAPYMSTKQAPSECPPVPVCGTACEQAYLEQHGCSVIQEGGHSGSHKRRKKRQRPPNPSWDQHQLLSSDASDQTGASGGASAASEIELIDVDSELGIAAGAAPLRVWRSTNLGGIISY